MMDYQKEELIGDWIKEKVLGSGGFGMVVLWRNRVSKEAIALKQCRWGHDNSIMTPKHRQRWQLEIDIMKRLSHPNVITAVNVPTCLDVRGPELPLLAMEYCSGGDLRKILNKPENCCGLVEKEIRLLIHDASAAIDYLHSKRIVHRDLKPENIVLQDENGKARFKLIDLGYAKDLDEGSVCTSFVGTLQYLAPELFTSKKYTCTVDYWSLGLVAVESMTGLRPFLHNLSPAKWMPFVRQKSPEDICAYFGSDGNVVFSNEIYSHNRVSRVFKNSVEGWLKLMLEWDPAKRGKGNSEAVQAFSVLNTVLSKKTFNIFCVHLALTLTYEVTDNMTVGNIQNSVAIETGLDIEEQEILSTNGLPITEDKLVSQFCTSVDESLLVVFKKSMNVLRPSAASALPPLVDEMFVDPMKKVKYDEQKKVYAHSVLYTLKECEMFDKLLLSHKILMTNLLTKNSAMNKSTNMLMSAVTKLNAKHDFFISSLKQDIDHYEQQSKGSGVCSKMMYDSWNSTMEYSLKIKNLCDDAHELVSKAGKLNTQTVELQRSPFMKSKPTENLDDVRESMLEIFSRLRKKPKEERNIPNDNQEIVQIVYKLLKQRDKLKNGLHSQLQKLVRCRSQILQLMQPIELCLKSIEDFEDKLLEWQLQRQKDLWNLVKILASKTYSMNGSPVTVEHMSVNNSNAVRQNASQLNNSADITAGSEQSMEIETTNYGSSLFQELMAQSTSDSLRIISDNRLLRHQMVGMADTLWKKHNEIMSEKDSMDFSFLTDDMLPK